MIAAFSITPIGSGESVGAAVAKTVRLVRASEHLKRISCEVTILHSAQKFLRSDPQKDGADANRDTSPW